MAEENQGVIIIGIKDNGVFSRISFANLTATQLSLIYSELNLISQEILSLINKNRQVQR